MQFVTSREYKLILSVDRFHGRKEGSKHLGDMLTRLAEAAGAESIERQDKEEKRQTCYLDTSDANLSRAHFSVRDRREESKRKLTLKFRSPDWTIAQRSDVSAPSYKDETKFEEDVMPEFRSVFSKSNWVSDEDLKLNKLGALVAVFPTLGSLGLPGNKEIVKVNGHKFREVFRKLCKVRFGDAKSEVKVGVSFWYSGSESGWPDIAELAFDYGLEDDGTFHAETAEGSKRLFLALQQQPGWCDLKGTTKTRFAYGEASTVFDRTL